MLSKWWGWGEEGKEYHLPDPRRFWRYLRARLGPTEAGSRIDSLERVHLSPSRLPAATLSALTGIVGQAGLSTESGERAMYSMGKGYKDLVRIRRGQVANPADARWLAAIKSALDPRGVMNPGKLIPEPSLQANPPVAESEARRG